MGTVVTIMNMKGGVGKTTVAMHLGGIIARYKLNKKRRRGEISAEDFRELTAKWLKEH